MSFQLSALDTFTIYVEQDLTIYSIYNHHRTHKGKKKEKLKKEKNHKKISGQANVSLYGQFVSV
ncbi:MAG: hypothetical protein ACI8RD_002282 [Bacillariaceae sp.]|jgi:hypothetical protein